MFYLFPIITRLLSRIYNKFKKIYCVPWFNKIQCAHYSLLIYGYIYKIGFKNDSSYNLKNYIGI